MVFILISCILFLCSLFLLHNTLFFRQDINLLKLNAVTTFRLCGVGVVVGITSSVVLFILAQTTPLPTHNKVAVILFCICLAPYLFFLLAESYNAFALRVFTKHYERMEANFQKNMHFSQEEALRIASDAMKDKIGAKISFAGIFHLNGETGYYKILIHDQKNTLIHTCYVHGKTGEILIDKTPK